MDINLDDVVANFKKRQSILFNESNIAEKPIEKNDDSDIDFDLIVGNFKNRQSTLYGEGSLDDFSSKIGDIGDMDIDLGGGGSTSKDTPATSSAPDITMPELNISDDIGSLDEHKSNDSIGMSTADMGGDDLGELNIDEIDDLGSDNGNVDDALSDEGMNMSDDDIDSMIDGLGNGGNTDDGTPDDTGNESTLAVSDEVDGFDDDLGIDESITDGDAGKPLDTISPEDNIKRKKRFIIILKRLYRSYKTKIDKFNTLNLPLDKERVFKHIFDDYIATNDLLEEYILTQMNKDDAIVLLNKITSFNILYTILDDRFATVVEYLRNPTK